MNLHEEALMLLDEAIDNAQRGRGYAASDYLRQAKKLLIADHDAMLDDNVDLGKQVESLQVQVTTLRENERIRSAEHNRHGSWTQP